MRLPRGESLAVLLGLAVPLSLVLGLHASIGHKLAEPPAAPTAALKASLGLAAAPAVSSGGSRQGTLAGARIHLTPTGAAAVDVRGQIAVVGDQRWRIDLEIVNRTSGVAAGTVWGVASVTTADGGTVQLASVARLPFKAKNLTRKSLVFALPKAMAGGVLAGFDVYVASAATGAVMEFSPVAH